MSNYMTIEELKQTYPDEWLIIEGHYDSEGWFLGGVVIERCTNETIDAAIIKYDKQGKHYEHLRTSTPYSR